MKLKELLEEFKNIDPESDVIFQMSDGCCGETFDLDDPWVYDGSYEDKKAGKTVQYITLVFPALNFLNSCISSGIAKDAVAAHRAKLGKKSD